MAQLKITRMVAWWGNPYPMIFWLFSMLFYIKWPIKFKFRINFDRQQNWQSYRTFLKEKFGDMIENYTNNGMVRESPPYDFLIIFNAILSKINCRIRIFELILTARQNWPRYRSCLKKKLHDCKLQIWWHGEGIPPYDFLIILHALLCKMTGRILFSNKFWPPGKIDRPIAVFS